MLSTRRHLDGAAVIAVFCLQVRGPADTASHPVWVWRPPGRDSATIPVLYFLHGYPGSAADPFGAGVADVLNHLLDRGYPPFVFASVDGNGERHSDTEWADSYNGGEQVMSRVVNAAIPRIPDCSARRYRWPAAGAGRGTRHRAHPAGDTRLVVRDGRAAARHTVPLRRLAPGGRRLL